MHFTEHPSYDGLLEKKDKRCEEYKKDYDTRGFDDSVTWSLDDSLIRWLTPRLTRFLEISEETTDAPEFHENVKKILIGFELYTSDEFEEFNKEHMKKLDESFKILAKIYRGLWW